VHILLEPIDSQREDAILIGDHETLDNLQPGDIVRLDEAYVMEVRPKRKTVTLGWPEFPNGSMLRVRFQNVRTESFPDGRKMEPFFGRVVATRKDLLEEKIGESFPGLDLSGDELTIAGRRLPNPLKSLKDLLQNRIRGTSSVIHGDLNLENILVGPGGLVWLIDFAATREGHTVFDFARLEVEITTQVLAENFVKHGLGIEAFLEVLKNLETEVPPQKGIVGDMQTILGSVRRIAYRCLYDPADVSEFRKALILAYLGSLKFANLDELEGAPLPKMLAFSAAAVLTEFQITR